MPVRKIPKSFRSVTGRFPSVINGRCVGYESKLEHDYFLTLEFDRTVKSYEEQPIRVPGMVKGKQVLYVPDCLVTFSNGNPQLLVEVKYKKELESDDENLKLKIARLHEYSAENNIRFKVVTEHDIKNVAFQNYMLLYRWAKSPHDFDSTRQHILNSLKPKAELSIAGLLACLNGPDSAQTDFLPSIYHMLFTGELTADLGLQLTYDSLIRIGHG